MKKLFLLVMAGAFALSLRAAYTGVVTLTVKKTDATITVDGKLDEAAWSSAAGDSIKRWYGNDLFGKPGHPATEDCSGAFKALWDDGALYIGITVTDDTLLDHNSNGSTFATWQEDLLELYVNANSTNLRNGASPSAAQGQATYVANGTYQFVQSAPQATTPAPTWGAAGIEMAATYDSVSAPHKYIYEYKINWSDVPAADGTVYTPTATDSLGFDLNITDNDGAGRRRIVWCNNADPENWSNMNKAGRLFFAPAGPSAVNTAIVNASSINVINNSTLRLVNVKASRVVVYNLLGSEVMNVKVTGNDINISGLTSGAYVAKAGSVIKKFVKR